MSRILNLSPAALSGSYTTGTAVKVPPGATEVLIHVAYTGGAGSTNGVASHKVLIGDGAFQATGPDGTYAVIAGVTAAAAATSKYAIGPVKLGGSTHVNLSSAETGDAAHAGSITAVAAFS